MNNECIDHGLVGNGKGYATAFAWGKKQRMHRVVYCKHHGLHIDNIAGLVVRHTCDNSRCINPDHLILGTVADNNRDRSIRGRHPFVKLTDAQVAEIRATCRPRSVPGNKPAGDFTYHAFAKRFGVSPASVRSAHLRRSFKHLP